MSVVLVNNFTAQTQYNAYITYTKNDATIVTQQPLLSFSAIVFPMNVTCTLFFKNREDISTITMIGPNVTPTVFMFTDQPITKTIYYEVGGSFIVFAWLLFNPANGVAFIMPNTLLSTAFNNAFGCPAPSLDACSGFYSTGPAAVIPGMPFQMTPFGGEQKLANFVSNSGHVNLSFPETEVINYLTIGSTPILQPFVPSRQWCGIVKAASTGKNIVLAMNNDMYVYGLNYSNTSSSYSFNRNSSYLNFTTLPGMLYSPGSSFGSLTNLSFQAVSTVPVSVDCGAYTNYGCKYNKDVCQLEDTIIGFQFCNPTLLSAKSYTPPAYNIIVSTQTTSDINEIEVFNNGNAYTKQASYSEPVLFTDLNGESSVVILCSATASTNGTNPNSKTTITVNAGMPPIIEPLLYTNNIIEYASITAWFDADRQTVFVSIVPQTLGGYFPLYGFLPNLYTYGQKPMLPSTLLAENTVNIGPGQGFSFNTAIFDINKHTWKSTDKVTERSTFVLLTSPDNGLLTLNFCSPTTNLITRLGFNGGQTLTTYIPSSSSSPDLEFFGVLNNTYGSSNDTTSSLLLSAVVNSEKNIAALYYILPSSPDHTYTRTQIPTVGNQSWNWADSTTWPVSPATFVPGLVNSSNDIIPDLAVGLGPMYINFPDTFYRTVTKSTGGGPSVASGPSVTSGPSVAATTGIKPKVVPIKIPNTVKMLAIVGAVVLVITIIAVLILANT